MGHVDEFRSLIEPLVREVPNLAAVAPAVDIVAGVEARGFLLGAAVGYARGTGIVDVRKPGRLPVVAVRESCTLEYGATTLELADGALGQCH